MVFFLSWATAKSIRILGFTVLLFSVLDILSRPIMLVLWTYDSPAGHGLLSLSLSTHQGMMVLMGGLFMVIGHIYVEAIRMADENRQYVCDRGNYCQSAIGEDQTYRLTSCR